MAGDEDWALDPDLETVGGRPIEAGTTIRVAVLTYPQKTKGKWGPLWTILVKDLDAEEEYELRLPRSLANGIRDALDGQNIRGARLSIERIGSDLATKYKVEKLPE